MIYDEQVSFIEKTLESDGSVSVQIRNSEILVTLMFKVNKKCVDLLSMPFLKSLFYIIKVQVEIDP